MHIEVRKLTVEHFPDRRQVRALHGADLESDRVQGRGGHAGATDEGLQEALLRRQGGNSKA